MSKSSAEEYYLSFTLGNLKLAIALSAVSRVLRSVEISPLPGAPDITAGVIDSGGTIIPVLNIRKRLGLEEKAISLNDKIILANTENLNFGFLVDDVLGLDPLRTDNLKPANSIIPGISGTIEGVAALNGKLLLVQNIEKFLSLGEENQINQAMKKRGKTS